MDIAALNTTKALRGSVLRWVSLCFGCLSLLLAAVNLTFSSSYSLAYLELGFAVYCLYTFLRLGKYELQAWQSIAMCASLSIIVVVATYIAPPLNGAYVWSFTLPVLYYLLLGKRFGVIFSAILLLLQTIILFNKQSLAPFTTLSLSLNLLLAYIIISITAHIFEGSRAEFSKRLKNLALLDPLTGAGNRLAMQNYFEVDLPQKSQAYLFLLDLDYFKQINDQYGHDIGDKVLIAVALILKKTFAKGYVFRIGGEEFALISSFKSEQAALAMAETLRLAVESKAIRLDGHRINLTTSMGVAAYQSGQTLTELVKTADKQLYKAKKRGRNNVYASFTQPPAVPNSL
jgi:diguanylate cyclase